MRENGGRILDMALAMKCSQMVISTLESMSEANQKARVLTFGLMERLTKENGCTAGSMAMVLGNLRVVISILDSGRMENQVDMESTLMLKETDMKDNGNIQTNMDKVSKILLMETSTLEILEKGFSKAMGK
jgi:hypothetical protein